MVYSSHSGAQSEHVSEKIFLQMSLLFRKTLPLSFENHNSWSAQLVALLSDLSFNLQTLTFSPPHQYRLQHSKFKAADNRLAFLGCPSQASQMWPVTSWATKLCQGLQD